MKDIKGKRLLILGGSLWKEAIKKFADENELTLVATGNDNSAGIFEIASEGYTINSTEKKAMKKLIREKNIDGVYMGGSEPVIAAASEYLTEMGMPSYCTFRQWEYLQNKANLKELYMKYGLPVAKKFDATEENADTCVSEEDFPVITKPVDGCGSSGFSVCHNTEELKRGIKAAKEASASGNIIVEKFMPNDGIVVFYRMCGGKLHFCCIEDKYPVRYEKQGSYVAGMFTFESLCTDVFRSRYEKKIEEMLTSIGITDGPLWFEVFTDGSEFCFNEVGYRYGGSVSIWPVQYYSGINEVASDIYYALTGESTVYGFNSIIPDTVPKGKHYCVYAIHLKPGKICTADGLEKIRSDKDVIALAVTKPIGSTIGDTGTVGQIFAFIHFLFDDIAELNAKINYIHSTLKILDENGNNMINRMVDTEKAAKRI